ncbi:polysaccharide export protein [Paucibacter sp. TC2R-5]|uniref:polysaccharide biosynthesis/export family protein n=1 Tax=Paucibacter sp. TC2R-5 TaxID=2893555 RepID=UPI0021E4FB81|nr:polysaccharide biosynthesis/export family protein [Paucibacter sp. TC2R-5]MCV2361775.1 polysaccharide export protein [Paucibacter sp. TC2R-5]
MYSSLHTSKRTLSLATCALLLSACAQFPTIGPSHKEVEEATSAPTAAGVIQLVNVDEAVARKLLDGKKSRLFSEALGDIHLPQLIGPGDSIEVNIWEAPPATLFGGGGIDVRAPSSSRATTLPEQVVNREGLISVPFAGRIQASGKSAQSLETDIAQRLKGKANQPEVLVRIVRNASSTATVVGEVHSSLRLPLTPSGERVLDAIAAAGGVKQAVSKVTVQVTRERQFHSLPLDTIIRDPAQNVLLRPGDVVTASYQPLSFTALGATGKNEEIAFETQGISLAQALARAGGLLDSRSDAQAVFIFRFEPVAALDWPRQPVASTPDGMVPVVYRMNVKDPSSFFAMQSFPISNKDILYVSNAPIAEFQKFLNVVFSITYPVLNTIQLTK